MMMIGYYNIVLSADSNDINVAFDCQSMRNYEVRSKSLAGLGNPLIPHWPV